LRRAQRNFSTTAPSLYTASHSLNADVRPEAIKKPFPKVKGSVSGLAQKLRESAPLMTEPYVAYGATRDLIKECSRPGEYKIPQAQIKGAEIPTIENGVHLGEGEGWWYDSEFTLAHEQRPLRPLDDILLTTCSSRPEAHFRQLVSNHLYPHVHAAGAL
jgi:hypothetical protein